MDLAGVNAVLPSLRQELLNAVSKRMEHRVSLRHCEQRILHELASCALYATAGFLELLRDSPGRVRFAPRASVHDCAAVYTVRHHEGLRALEDARVFVLASSGSMQILSSRFSLLTWPHSMHFNTLIYAFDPVVLLYLHAPLRTGSAIVGDVVVDAVDPPMPSHCSSSFW